MRTILTIGFVAIVSMSFTYAPGTVACGNLETCSVGGITGHTICGEIGINLYTNNHCTECRVCIGDWFECHPWCGQTDDDEQTQHAYDTLLQALHLGDVAAALQVLPEAGQLGSVNLSRRAIQVRSCSADRLIASVPVPDELWAVALEADLRRSARYADN
jgi:hypothetical protein